MNPLIKKTLEILGSQAALARELGIKPPSVNEVVNDPNRQIPESWCQVIERATKGAVTCEQLRGDIAWPRVEDAEWPHPSGKPYLDHAPKAAA